MHAVRTDEPTLYRRIADHYLGAIRAGSLGTGARFPSVRRLMSTHEVSLSTALQACRYLEDQGWLEARPRSGYFVRQPRRAGLLPANEVQASAPPDPADYVGIHARVSEIIALGQQQPVSVNLALAIGAPELYPGDALQRTMQRLLRQQPAILTTQSRRHGHPLLRGALARRALSRGIVAAPEEVVVTHGCIESINLALRAVTRPGDTVVVESPTFYGLLQVLESLGLRALEVPASPYTGLSLDALAFALEQDASIKAVVSMPTGHNPLGCVMPDAHKQRLVQLCEARGIALIEDDIYGDMGGDTPYRAAKAFDRGGHVIYCHSLNKLLAPGFRLGWMIAGRWQARIEMLKYANTRYNEELPQMVAGEFIDGPGYDRHLQKLRQSLRTQREQMAECVARYFPAGTRLSVPEAGMLLWVELPEGVSSYALFKAALAEGIKLSPGGMFSNSPRFDNFLRLSCGRPHSAAVEAALKRVGALIG
jgi:DNA-binding transcriptional MocR family regulator